ncbi:SMI1/KNR4 family protein [Nocardiopsis sp. HUAS JQ3]|uniref:SMI1/KNR4 family protein n=1 Tax=Nocardiopsis sp. HUAS JQ3 TaxID=3061629 RepID=UPI0023A94FB5|nr:SMI1/KNR4 family protein [Nocardiopsis sp. HUAS JQ3]WDZ88311.1 SMI1/KNR4 family protein [Nocardiopsis sp. HUAS JQ3]
MDYGEDPLVNEERGTAPSGRRLTTPEQWRAHLNTDGAAAAPGGRAPEEWSGHGPATDEQIERAERRLGLRTPLPPSYRAFLAATDGWDELGLWCGRALSAHEVQWLATARPYLGGFYEDDEVYGPLLESALVLNEGEDLWLLDPREAGADGEWAAYLFQVKYGDFDRADSFSDLWHHHDSRLARW